MFIRNEDNIMLETAPSKASYNVALVHTIDPRGTKVGGIETFVRDYITFHPEDMNLLLIGVDAFGDLKLGEVHKVSLRGRTFDFLPIIHIPDDESSVPVKGGLLQTQMFRFVRALYEHRAKLRSLLKDGGYSIDLRRIELAFFPALLGRPFVQMLHDGATKDKEMSSVLKNVWWVKGLAERFAVNKCSSFYCVNSDLTERLRGQFPRHAAKLGTLPTWANPEIFSTRPFVHGGDLNVVFAGRLDLFKRPDLMFNTIAELRRIAPNVKLHYVGDGVPTGFPEYAAIQDITLCHGRKTSEEIAQLYRDMHVGILTSDFEGMPRFVMEMLSVGRPVVALHLPQLEQVIHDGQSGYLIERTSDATQVHAARILDIYRLIQDGTIQPQAVSQYVEDFSARRLLGKLYSDHRRFHGLAQ